MDGDKRLGMTVLGEVPEFVDLALFKRWYGTHATVKLTSNAKENFCPGHSVAVSVYQPFFIPGTEPCFKLGLSDMTCDNSPDDNGN